LLFLVNGIAFSQPKKDWKEAGQEKLAKMDVSSIKTGHLLNLGLFTKKQMDQFRQKAKNKQGLTSSAFTEESWKALYENLTVANIKADKKYKPYSDFALTSKQQKENSAVIPIGIINVDATLLDSAQVEQNIKQKEQGKKADSKKYETVYVLAASVLQEQVYQANVQFRLSPSLHFTNNDNPITGLELDFQDGKGFQAFGLQERLINYTYQSVGTHGITIKLRTQRGIYLFQTQVNIRSLTRPVFQREFSITAQRVKTDPNARAVGFTGGNARVVVGCDNVFDKPIIIAEGFDPSNDNTLAELQTRYTAVFAPMTNRGYDLVFLDWTDGRDYIQNNAQVLMSLIREVNRLKSGSSPLIVIGESMGGLVARYALTEFERQGNPHNVSHYISFDSPHQGANVAIGLQTLIEDVRSSPTANLVELLAPGTIPAELIAIANSADTPAAKQMLMHWKGAEPNAAFTAFQTEQRNRGYPTQCRNLAIINGSVDPNAQLGGYAPGSEVIRMDLAAGFSTYFLRAWTNSINRLDAVSSLYSILLPEIKIRYENLPVNHDLIPGGSRDGDDINRNFRFAFVPSYSGIDYRGPLNNDNDLYITARTAQARGFTPFAAVYGDGNNTEHVSVINEQVAWQDLFATEFNAPVTGSNCTAQTNQAPPPLPQFSVPRFCGDGSGVTAVTLETDPGLDGLFDYSWTVQPGNIAVNGPSLFVTLNMLSSGAATITATVRSRLNPSLVSLYSQTVRPCDVGYVCAYQEGEFIFINSSGVSYYARRANGQQYASLANGQFIPRSELLANGVPSGLAACFPETDPRGGTPVPGNYEGNLDGADCNYIAGWVYDSNNPNGSLNVEVLEGSTVVATGVASNYRSDLVASGKGNGQHGYIINTPASLKNGQSHTLWVRVANTNFTLTGSYQAISCGGTGGGTGGTGGTTGNPNGAFEGHFDYSGCESLTGWVYDQNSANAHLNIEVLSGSTVIATGTAATYRQDLQVAGKGNGEHGFNLSTPDAVKNGQNQTLSIRVAGTGYIMANSPRTINCAGTGSGTGGNTGGTGGTPTGNYEGHFDYADCGSVGGWVYDLNGPNTHLNIELVDGSTVVATGTAANFRQDLLNAGKGNGEHGFGLTLPASLKNGQNHILSIRVSNGSYVLSESPRTINCPGGGGRVATVDEVVDQLLVYPNPTSDEVTLSFRLDQDEAATLTLVDIAGRSVYTSHLLGRGVVHQERISLQKHPVGLYVVRVASPKRTLSGKVILSR